MLPASPWETFVSESDRNLSVRKLEIPESFLAERLAVALQTGFWKLWLKVSIVPPPYKKTAVNM